MAKSKLASMSVDELLRLRDEITAVLGKKADELKEQLSLLSGGQAPPRARRGRPRGSALRGRKVAPKYRGPGGETWTGRGIKPRWLSAALKDGKKLDDFLIARRAGKPGRRK